MKVAVTVSPNNQFKVAISSLQTKAKKLSDPQSVIKSNRVAVNYGSALMEIVQGFSGGMIINCPGESKYSCVSARGLAIAQEVKTRALDIIHEFQRAYLQSKEEKKYAQCRLRSGWGFSGRRSRFTKLARHKILCGGAVLARECSSPSDATFVTFTLPGNTSAAIGGLARWSSYLCNRLLQYIRRADRKVEQPYEWFYSWEFQRRGALHLHLCLSHCQPGYSYALAECLKEAWFSILKDLSDSTGVCFFSDRSGKKCFLPQFWQVDVKPVEKSVANYVSKYVSKGQTESDNNARRFTPPARWWGMARSLGRKVAAQSSVVTFDNLTEDEASTLFCDVSNLLNLHTVVQQYQYTFDISHGDYHVGSGTVVNYYLLEHDFTLLRDLFVSYISALPAVSERTVIGGKGFLYKGFAKAA